MSPPLSAASDEELVELSNARRGRDERPFGELFRRHHRTIWGLCFRTFGRQEVADELTQEVFLKAYRGLARFEGRSAFKTWLYRIGLNVCQNEQRRRRRHPEESGSPLEEGGEPSVGAAAEAQAVRDSERWLLRLAWERLRHQEREILELAEVQECPYGEIAARLGLGLSAVKMRVQRARLALRKSFLEVEAEVEEGEWTI